MRKNGFTLIEIIGVIIVMAMIILLTMPNVIETLRKAEAKNYEEFLKTIELVTEQYVESNANVLDLEVPGDFVVVEIEDIINAGYINSKIENPKTKEKINNNDIVTVTLEDDYTKSYVFKSIDE